ncbi:MAG: SdiA-regulated domain-containing protein [Chitinispirillia bacterium]|jgi:uncharacterized protein YjiK
MPHLPRKPELNKDYIFCIYAAVLLLSLFCTNIVESSHLPLLEKIACFSSGKLSEPSGCVYLADQGALIVVGDKGDISKIDTNGTVIKYKRLGNYDLEGICYNPVTRLLYSIVESKSLMLEIETEDFVIFRKLSISWILNNKKILRRKDEHIEGITFVKRADFPAGGYFVVVNKSNNTARPSALIELSFDVKNAKLISPVKMTILNILGLTGITVKAETGTFYVTTKDGNRFIELSRSGEMVNQYIMPGRKIEGICITNNNQFYITDDKENMIYKIQP